MRNSIEWFQCRVYRAGEHSFVQVSVHIYKWMARTECALLSLYLGVYYYFELLGDLRDICTL